MKKTIWKFPLDVTDETECVMPVGSELLTVQTQGDTLCVWALVDPDPKAKTESRSFRIFGTGHVVEERRVARLPRRGARVAQVLGPKGTSPEMRAFRVETALSNEEVGPCSR